MFVLVHHPYVKMNCATATRGVRQIVLWPMEWILWLEHGILMKRNGNVINLPLGAEQYCLLLSLYYPFPWMFRNLAALDGFLKAMDELAWGSPREKNSPQ